MGASLAGGVVQSLGWEDSLELGNGNPLQCSRLKTPLDRGLPMADHSPWGHRVGHDLPTKQQADL